MGALGCWWGVTGAPQTGTHPQTPRSWGNWEVPWSGSEAKTKSNHLSISPFTTQPTQDRQNFSNQRKETLQAERMAYINGWRLKSTRLQFIMVQVGLERKFKQSKEPASPASLGTQMTSVCILLKSQLTGTLTNVAYLRIEVSPKMFLFRVGHFQQSR